MAKLPREPDLQRLRAAEPNIVTIDSNQPLHRIYKRSGNFPTLWNTFRHYGPISRFDHHLVNEQGDPFEQERGILYAASDITTAVAEFFQYNQRRVNRTRHQPWMVSFRLTAPVRLLDLTDAFCVRVGASMKLVSGPFAHAQAWSRGFYESYPMVHGLYYLSSLTNRPTVALYERANTATLFSAGTRFHRALADPLLHKPLTLVVDEIGYGLV